MNLGIVGCAGRMGRMVTAEVLAANGCELAAGTEPPASEHMGVDLGALAGGEPQGVTVTDDAEALFKASDAVIDFTVPDATLAHAALAGESGTALIVGTTGLKQAHMDALNKASENTIIVQAANMSAGVNVLLGLVEQAAGLLGDDYDIEIVEMHHRHKVDSPSGTALGLGKAAAAGRGVDLDAVAARGRDGITGARKRGDIGFSAIRGGDVVGEHDVIFAAAGERIVLRHIASDRALFARGALRAALWGQDKGPGAYDMLDVLGLGDD